MPEVSRHQTPRRREPSPVVFDVVEIEDTESGNVPDLSNVSLIDLEPSQSWRSWLKAERERAIMPQQVTLTSTRTAGGSEVEGLEETLSAEMLNRLSQNGSNVYVRWSPDEYTGKVSAAKREISAHIERLGFKPSFGLTKAEREDVELNGETFPAGTIHVTAKGRLPEAEAADDEDDGADEDE